MNRCISVAALWLSILCVTGFAKTPEQLKTEFADILPPGMKARLAWTNGSTVYVVDSDSGIIRELTPASIFPGGTRSLQNPNVTHDGSRVIFRDGSTGQCYVINWDGTGLRSFMSMDYGFVSRYWYDRATRSHWAIYDRYGIRRINIDKPANTVLLWDKTGRTWPGWFTLSEDGTRVGMESTGQIVGIGVVPNGDFVAGDSIGCRVSIAPDNSYDFLFQTPYHKLLRMCDSNGVKKRDYVFNDTIIAWAKARGAFVGGLLEHDNCKWINHRDYIIFYMNCTSVNPFIMRLSDGSFMSIQDGLSRLGTADMAVFPQGTPVDAPPVIATVDDLSCQITRPTQVTVGAIGTPLPTLEASGLPPWMTIGNGATPARSFVLSGTPTEPDTFEVILTASNRAGTDRDTFLVRVGVVNDPPSVFAGRDTVIRRNYIFSLVGTVNDDGAVRTPELTWKQLSGPSQSTIDNQASLSTTVSFADTGLYRFQLRAFDGAFNGYDTVAVRALAAIPFQVRRPATGMRIALGSQDSIVWQIDPPAEVVIELSVDGGITFNDLPGRAVSAGTTSWTWAVSEDLQPSDSCFVRVTDYNDRGEEAVSGMFSLVSGPSGVGNSRQPAGPVRNNRPLSEEFYSIDGRRIDPRLSTIGPGAAGISTRVVVIRRVRGGRNEIATRVFAPKRSVAGTTEE